MKVCIAGAGVMGQLMALMLINEGYHVTIFDSNPNGNCSQAAAGLLTPAAELEKCDTSIYEMGVTSLSCLWPEIISLLPEPVYFKSSGSLLVSHQRDHAEMGRLITLITAKITDKNDVRAVDHDEINNLEPELNRFASGYYLPNEGHIDNQNLLRVLSDYLHSAGVIMHLNHRINDIFSESIHYDLTIDCRGLGAKNIFPELRAVRGELIWLHAPTVNISRPVRFIHPRYSLYIVPRPGQIYLVGASEIEAEDYSEISVQTTLELLSAAYCLHPGFAEARIIKMVSHCRPTLNHHAPHIKFRHDVIAINGLYRHGFLLAPTLAREVLRFIQHGFSVLKYPEMWSQAA